jgi:hypothetical protein
MTLEDRLEKTFPGTRFADGYKVEEAKQRHRILVQVPLLARLSREGTVALGDVYSHCIAIGGMPLAGRPAQRASILVLDADGGAAVVACALQGKGVHANGARRLAKIDRRLRTIDSQRALEALYRKACGKRRKKESLVDLAVSHWEGATKATVQRARDGWIETLSSGRTALYLAMERRASDKPSKASDPITPMQKLLESRSGGILQVLVEVTRTKPQNKYLEALDEPPRIIWVYRRMIP